MNRLLRHFDPKMPLYLLYYAAVKGYDPEEFISWYLGYPDIAEGYGEETLPNFKFKRYLILYAYYFWVLYLVCAVLTVAVAPVIAIIAVIMSPFIVAGALYALLFLVWHMNFVRLLGGSEQKQVSKSKKSTKKSVTTKRKR